MRLKAGDVEREIEFTLSPDDSFTRVFERQVKKAFAEEMEAVIKGLNATKEKTKAVKAFIKGLQVDAEFTHRHYVSDHEYIPYGEDIEAFLKREIGKQIIRWQDSPQLGYEILPNKYFYQYELPKPTDELLNEFWELEKEAEKTLKDLAGK